MAIARRPRTTGRQIESDDRLRLFSLEYATALLDETTNGVEMADRAAETALNQLVCASFCGDDDDVEEAELQVEAVEQAQLRTRRRYESAFNKLAFEVGQAERLK
jgi:hypothetical protein